MTVNVLFVCLGNICRSPSAEGVFRNMIAREGLSESVSCDSAGTSDWHIGKSPDARATETAARRGYDLNPLRARQATPQDFGLFDYVIAMDHSNHANLRAIAPAGQEDRLHLMMAFAPDVAADEVPDPYYDGNEGFEAVLDMLEAACGGLIDHIRTNRLSA